MKDLTLKLVEEKLQSLPKDLNELVLNKFRDVETQSEKIEFLEKENGHLQRLFDTKSNTLDSLIIELNTLKALKLRKEELDKKQRDLEIVVLNHKLEMSNQSKLDIYNLVNMFMKNPRAIEILNTNYNTQPMYNDSGLMSGSEKISEFGTKEKTETKG